MRTALKFLLSMMVLAGFVSLDIIINIALWNFIQPLDAWQRIAGFVLCLLIALVLGIPLVFSEAIVLNL